MGLRHHDDHGGRLAADAHLPGLVGQIRLRR